MLIADAFAAQVSDAVAAQVPVVARIHDIVQHVPVENGRAAVELAREAQVDVLLTIGGGSSTGLAKFVARDTGIPIVAVPSTFAGSEATNVWGQTDGDRKVTGVDDLVLPRVIIYDATLSASLPGHLATASGMNALAHAVDGLWAPRADPINRALGSEAIRVLVPGLTGDEGRPRRSRCARADSVRRVPRRGRLRLGGQRHAPQDLPRSGRRLQPVACRNACDRAALCHCLQCPCRSRSSVADLGRPRRTPGGSWPV